MQDTQKNSTLLFLFSLLEHTQKWDHLYILSVGFALFVALKDKFFSASNVIHVFVRIIKLMGCESWHHYSVTISSVWLLTQYTTERVWGLMLCNSRNEFMIDMYRMTTL